MTFLNDFVVTGYGILSNIQEGVDYVKLNNNKKDPNGSIATIGPGTGLGHGYLTRSFNSKDYDVYPSEGGHQTFAPQTDLQYRYSEYLRKHYNIQHISVERACSGPVLPVLLSFFLESEKRVSEVYKSVEDIKNVKNEEIIKNSLSKKCSVCVDVLTLFSEMFGAAAGNSALLLMATGGIYLTGGLSIALEEHLRNDPTFINNFLNKGRLRPMLEKFPIFIVKNSLIGVKGAEVYLLFNYFIGICKKSIRKILKQKNFVKIK